MPAPLASRQAEQDRLYSQDAEHRCSNDQSVSGDETRLPCGCSRPTFKRALSSRTTRPSGTHRPGPAPFEPSALSALARSRCALQSYVHLEITAAVKAPPSRPRPPAAAPHSFAAAAASAASDNGRPSPARLHTALSVEVSPRSSDSSGARADFLSSSSPRSPRSPRRNTLGLDLAFPSPHGLARRLSLPTSPSSVTSSSSLPAHLLFVPGLSCATSVPATPPCPAIRVPSRRRVSSIAEAHCGAWAIPGAGLLVSPSIAGWAPTTTAASSPRTPATSPSRAPPPPAAAGGKTVFSGKKLKRVLQSLMGL